MEPYDGARDVVVGLGGQPGLGNFKSLQRRKGNWQRAGEFLETDAFAAQLGVGKLLLGRHRLAGMRDEVRKRRMLCEQQQQSQQQSKVASKVHRVWSRVRREV